jgi:large subunit ribosomal protein L24
MKKFKKGDMVLVTGGKDKGKTGKIIKIIPKKDKVVVSGVNMYSRHVKPTQNKEGGVMKIERAMSPAKIMLLEKDKPVRVGLKRSKDGVTRISKKTGTKL